MARKSVKGYFEKNFYDNTKFTGGIVATHDTLNEGSFKHLVNFDISDMGQSITPRKGFITTTLKYNDKVITLSSSTIYFFDANIGKYIFIDFNKGYINADLKYIPCIYKANLDLDNLYITDVVPINNLDYSDLIEYFNSDMSDYLIDMKPESDNVAQSVIDEYGITKYIIKAKSRDKIFWMSIVYREEETKYENIVYPKDTVVLSYLNFDDTVNINSADRNIASAKPIIPNPMQKIYSKSDEPPEFIETFPLIYVKKDEDYLLETTQDLNNIKFIPHYLLKEPDNDNYIWSYTYDIISTSSDVSYLQDKLVHRSTLYDLKTNDSLITRSSIKSDYRQLVQQVQTDYNVPSPSSTDTDFYYKWSPARYNSYISDLDITKNNIDFMSNMKDVLVVHVGPKITNTIDPVKLSGFLDSVDISMYEFIPILSNTKFTEDGITSEAASYNLHVDESSIFKTANNKIQVARDFKNNAANLTLFQYDVIELISKMNNIPNINNYRFYIKKYSELVDYFDSDTKGYSNYIQTSTYARIIAFKDEGMDFDEFCKHISKYEYTNIIFRPFTTVSKFEFDTPLATGKNYPNNTELCKLFYNADKYSSGYYVYTDLDTCVDNFQEVSLSDLVNNHLPYNNAFNILFQYRYSAETTELLAPMLTRTDLTKSKSFNDPVITTVITELNYYGASIFTRDENDNLVFNYSTDTSIIKSLHNKGFFEQGISIVFYIIKIPKKDYVDSDPILSKTISYTRDYFITTSSYKQSRQIIMYSAKPTTIIQQLETEPKDIAEAKNSLIFRSSLGDCLVLYTGNKVYMSEPSYQYYFKYTGLYEYPEPIIKVIQYKDTLLVFTTQNLYSIYPTEITNSVENGTDEEGNTKYVQVTTTVYATLPVLYNLMVDSKYKDAIQVYNQMILFYSADGQMFMIKPSATIDNDTRFSIQYFNKSVNDILLNYKDYMQERLSSYGINKDIEDVNIKVSVSINFIKIFYSAPGLITYILIYDIINNRYYVYDTIDFTNIRNFWYNDGYEVYVSIHKDFMYFTQQYNDYSDISQYYNFTQHGIETELDTGIINLNNHLKKRFKDVHVMYKNITADTLKFSSDTYVDDVPVYLDIQSSIEVRNVATRDTYIIVDTDNRVNLLEENTALFDFSKYNSNRILTHRSNIVSRGKTFQTQLHFNSTGLYKIISYGIIYKEHTV